MMKPAAKLCLGLLWLALCLTGGSAFAQDTKAEANGVIKVPQVLHLDTDEPLSPELQEVLKRIAVAPVYDQLARNAYTQSIELDETCGEDCGRRASVIWNFNDFQYGNPSGNSGPHKVVLPWVSQSRFQAAMRPLESEPLAKPGNYFVIPQFKSAGITAAGLHTSQKLQELLVPLDGVKFSETLSPSNQVVTMTSGLQKENIGMVAVDPGWDDLFSGVEESIELGFRATASLKIRDGVDPEDLSQALELLKASRSALAQRTDLRAVQNLPNGLSSDSVATCAATQPNWPYDPTLVSKTLKQNAVRFADLRLSPARSRVLIVDSGVTRTLSRSDLFRDITVTNASELLLRPRLFRTNQTGSRGVLCHDWDKNKFIGDIYGASGEMRLPIGKTTCIDGFDPLEQLISLDRLDPENVQYDKRHGSYIATLAAGAPELIDAAKDYIGLAHFRATGANFSLGGSPFVEINQDYVSTALDYGGRSGFDVINLSLRTRDGEFYDVEEQSIGPGTLIVTSAGNSTLPIDLDNEADGFFPASLQSGDFRNQMIVVAALAKPQSSDAAPMLWNGSNMGVKKVDIAAPGEDVSALLGPDQLQCASGTSGAAAIVTFTAGLLKSFGLSNAIIIKQRILGSADVAMDLKVAHSRVLNVPAALDLFVDQVVFKDGEVLRGLINESSGVVDNRLRFFRACQKKGEEDTEKMTGRLADSNGLLDLSTTARIERIDEGFHIFQYNPTGNFIEMTCPHPPTGTFEMVLDQSSKSTPVAWEDVKSIVPTPFRNIVAE